MNTTQYQDLVALAESKGYDPAVLEEKLLKFQKKVKYAFANIYSGNWTETDIENMLIANG